jgi:hypothetical protein
MTATARAIGLIAVLSAVVCSDGLASEGRQGRQSDAWLGACYCRAAGTLECTADLSERECRRRCDEALCDDWIWKERLPCWNWGYGG